MLIMTQPGRLCNGFDICQSLLHGDLDSKMLAIERLFPVPIVVQPLVLLGTVRVMSKHKCNLYVNNYYNNNVSLSAQTHQSTVIRDNCPQCEINAMVIFMKVWIYICFNDVNAFNISATNLLFNLVFPSATV